MRKNLLALILFLTVSVSCDKDIESSIPDVAFLIDCDMRQAAYSSLNSPGQFVSIDKNLHGVRVGYGGLIVGQSAFPGFNNEAVFVAFDKACPVEVSSNVSVELKNDGVGRAVCPKCKTEYDLNNGGAPKGAGSEYLKQYQVVKAGEYVLRIQNR